MTNSAKNKLSITVTISTPASVNLKYEKFNKYKVSNYFCLTTEKNKIIKSRKHSNNKFTSKKKVP